MATLIADKLARVASACKAAGITGKDRNHLLHGCGGSPRRAKRAIKYGLADFLTDAYAAVWAETQSHAKATKACDDLWCELMADEFASSEAAEDTADTEPTMTLAEASDELEELDAKRAAAMVPMLKAHAESIGLTITDAELLTLATGAASEDVSDEDCKQGLTSLHTDPDTKAYVAKHGIDMLAYAVTKHGSGTWAAAKQ